MTILEEFSYGDTEEFKKDFILVMKMAFEIDAEYGSIDPSFLHNNPEYEECLSLFSKKYRDIILKPGTDPNSKNLRILFDEESLIGVFEIAKKIKKPKAVGRNALSAVNINNTKRVEQMLTTTSENLYIEYYVASKSESIMLKFDKKEKKPELIYSKEGIIDMRSPEFKLCAYYGCLNGFDKKIDLMEVAKTFFRPGKGIARPTWFWG